MSFFEQSCKKLHTTNSKIKTALNLFSTKVFIYSEENNLDAWSFLISLKIKVENELMYQLNNKKKD